MKKEVLIIGGGIVGLATAWRLMEARLDLKVTVLEKEPELATHQTGHNSGVIHSGIYYRPGTLRARNCMEGYGELLRFCDEHGIPYDICGKVIVATRPEELPQLDKILDHGLQNGLKDIRRISAAETREHEPHVNVVESLWVPQAGIINYRKVANKYAELITARGGVIRTGFKVTSIKRSTNEITVIGEAGEVSGDLLISCAGLYADKVAKMTGQKIPGIQILPFRGEYYELKPEKQYLVNNLIYPVPNPEFPFLGVHYTRMIEGGIEAGPNAVLAFRREGYSRWDIDLPELLETLSYPGFMRLAAKHWRYGWGEMYRSFSKSAFVKALQHLIPDVGYDDLQRGGAGVRAMACDLEGKLIDEFLIFEDHNIINVCSAPSPAATASLAIGKTIAGKALLKF
ncbi:MAG TPA: L-2-hydroxyglutarate oxidase [Haliscomenobacter sp.]|uniref:L-2-hydroxyglutarate oxidase n=1 Tax=Haliscomenobacter sp. TaxID=2717303 RepID=UPI002C98387E|nr:L-2-hydroxyglutarate oxidase [Haliscomenobacter sp.]HOY15839.1 L-2-hydroxyglutarate oxidase [Haliscomenobacter sp.]